MCVFAGPPATSKARYASLGEKDVPRGTRTPTMKKAAEFDFGKERPQTNPYLQRTQHYECMGPRFEKIKPSQKSTPGPGTYTARYSQAKSVKPGWKLGTSNRDDMDKYKMRVSNFPPPDTYNPKVQATREQRASWTFGTGGRSNLAEVSLFTPAPGVYNTEKKQIEGPKFSIYGKLDATSVIGTELRRVRANPGPGTYKPDHKKINKNGGIFTIRSKLHVNYDDKVPGPGTYSRTFNKSVKGASCWSFSNQPQREPLPLDKYPGPGAYKVPCEIGNLPQYTMARPTEFAVI